MRIRTCRISGRTTPRSTRSGTKSKPLNHAAPALRRAVVTGIGIVSPIGTGVRRFRASTLAATLGTRRPTRSDASGANVHGEVSGYGVTSDAHHMTAPRPDGAGSSRAMSAALREARVGPDELELANAHGSSGPLDDVTETTALTRALDDAAIRVSLTATKGQHAHALFAIREKKIPRTVNLEHADPACDLDDVRETRPTAPRIVLSNLSDFRGINAALVLRGTDY